MGRLRVYQPKQCTSLKLALPESTGELPLVVEERSDAAHTSRKHKRRSYCPSDVDIILSNLRVLRDQVVTAWCERGVVLNSEEQAALHAEIKRTCDFLTDLTRHP
jgi:hypothetical protein